MTIKDTTNYSLVEEMKARFVEKWIRRTMPEPKAYKVFGEKAFKMTKEWVDSQIKLCLQDLTDIAEEAKSKRFAEGFKKGQESVKRRNKSGCCCIIEDSGEITSVCGAHKEWLEEAVREAKDEQNRNWVKKYGKKLNMTIT